MFATMKKLHMGIYQYILPNKCFRYVLDGFPVTLKQTELMDSHRIIPMLVVELELDTLEVLKRGQIDKMNPNK